MSTRMTSARLAGMVAAGDSTGVREAVAARPELLSATVERDGRSGWTPLHLAAAAGHGPVVEVLAAAGADLDARAEDGRSPLHLALERSPDLVPVLRRLGAVVDAASAAFLGDTERLTSTLDGGPGPATTARGVDLLSCAAAGGSVATVAVLLDRGAVPDDGALHAAAAAGAAPVVELLLAAGADVDGRDRDTGRTPLHTAVGRRPPAPMTGWSRSSGCCSAPAPTSTRRPTTAPALSTSPGWPATAAAPARPVHRRPATSTPTR